MTRQLNFDCLRYNLVIKALTNNEKNNHATKQIVKQKRFLYDHFNIVKPSSFLEHYQIMVNNYSDSMIDLTVFHLLDTRASKKDI